MTAVVTAMTVLAKFMAVVKVMIVKVSVISGEISCGF